MGHRWYVVELRRLRHMSTVKSWVEGVRYLHRHWDLTVLEEEVDEKGPRKKSMMTHLHSHLHQDVLHKWPFVGLKDVCYEAVDATTTRPSRKGVPFFAFLP